MGAQRSNGEGLDELDIVVDISRERARESTDSEESGDMMEEEDAAWKLKAHQVEAVVEDVDEPAAAAGASVPVASRNGVESDSSPVKVKNRKRKKTIHFKNSRVPHAIPTLESESDDGEEESGSHDDVGELPSARQAPGPRSAASKLKAMMPIGDKLPKPPRNAKELMATGLLEGHYVHCSCRGEQLTGVLQDMGVVCNCRICKGTQVVSISAFEAHSGSTSHHPSDNIYLENGKNLRDILSAGQEAADCGDNIFRALKHAIGEIQGFTKVEVSCGKCGKPGDGNLVSCKGVKCSTVYHAECVGIASPHRGDWLCAKCEKSQARKPQTLLKTKRSSIGTDREDVRLKEKEITAMARSARDAHLHKALFLPGGLADGTELGYYARNQCVLKGMKQGGGICCSCCNQEISCSAFEQHAGCEARRNPYGSILLSDGRSLKDLSKELADQSKLGDRAKQIARIKDSKSCAGCGAQDDLAPCQSCDSAWCSNCAKYDTGTENKPSSHRCRNCHNDISSATKGTHKLSNKRVDLGANIPATNDRNVRHFHAPDSSGGCAICKKWTLNKANFDQTMLVCDQCGREYHVGCLRESGRDDEIPDAEWFCHPSCQNIKRLLRQLVSNGPESLTDSIVSELLESRQHQQVAFEMAESSSPLFGWQILHGPGDKDAANGRTLAEAVDIFTECSDPIRDASSGRDVISSMVNSRNFRGYDFDGIYCVVLKLNDKVVSTALLQIFGREVAEVPLVATSLAHQGLGYCKALFTTIERLLGVLDVERLVLPVTKEAESIWIREYGFSRMEDPQLKQLQSTIRLMTFSGTGMLYKPIPVVKLEKPIALLASEKSNDHWVAERR
jgi:hypothetical protein